MIAAIGAPGPASMNSTRPKRWFSTIVKLRGSTTDSDETRVRSCPPIEVPCIQRSIEATTSAVVTGLPSWKRRPSRRVKL
jgi:hypothetical protein